jgi:hypothetical protein
MTGLDWLAERPGAGNWPFCFTFVRGASEHEVLQAFGADPKGPADADAISSGTPAGDVIRVGRSGEWIFVLEESSWPQGIRPDVLQQVSRGGEAVMVFQEIGKGNHQFAHAFNGEIMAAVTTSIPPSWGGQDPQRLIPLANELGLGPDGWDELTPLEALLALAEGVFGLSLEETDIQGARAVARIAPAGEPHPPARPAGPPTFVDPRPAREHVQRLIDAGMDSADIARLGGMSPVGIDRLLRGVLPQLRRSSSEQVLAIEIP